MTVPLQRNVFPFTTSRVTVNLRDIWSSLIRWGLRPAASQWPIWIPRIAATPRLLSPSSIARQTSMSPSACAVAKPCTKWTGSGRSKTSRSTTTGVSNASCAAQSLLWRRISTTSMTRKTSRSIVPRMCPRWGRDIWITQRSVSRRPSMCPSQIILSMNKSGPGAKVSKLVVL